MWVRREAARLNSCQLQLVGRSWWVPMSAHKLSPCHFVHSLSKCLSYNMRLLMCK